MFISSTQTWDIHLFFVSIYTYIYTYTYRYYTVLQLYIYKKKLYITSLRVLIYNYPGYRIRISTFKPNKQ